MSNRTMSEIMQRKTQGKPWAEARKKLIEEAKANLPKYMHDKEKMEQPRRRRG